MANFWTDGTLEPKRQNRWVVQFDGIYGGNMFFATKVQRPTIEVSKKEHKYLNHTFNYPGRVTWQPITLTMVDTQGGSSVISGVDTMNSIMTILQNSGYVVPNDNATLNTIKKSRAVKALSTPRTGDLDTSSSDATNKSNGVTITMVNQDGRDVEKWTLRNAFITKITPSELTYEDDGIATVDIEITYDFCVFSPGSGRNAIGETEKFNPTSLLASDIARQSGDD